MSANLDDHVGFTGTRYGMTAPQSTKVAETLAHRGDWLHHGSCVGADVQANDLARAIGMLIAVHPSTSANWRARVDATVVHPPKPPLDRNHDIVDCCGRLIAAPAEFEEQHRSGTWATVRYARRIGKPVVIVFPDGSVAT